MYNNDNDQNRSSYEYHYSYRPESGSFQPEQTPVLRKAKKHGGAKKIVACVLCAVLLVLGGAFGASWYLNIRNAAPKTAG